MGPEVELCRPKAKRAFWYSRNKTLQMATRSYIDVNPDRLSAEVMARTGKRATLRRDHREAHPENEYDTILVAKMERTTPQFNLRNVHRVVKDIDLEWTEWGSLSLPDRHGFEADLKHVRTFKHEPPVFESQFYSSNVNNALRRELNKVFYINDWEQWYGEDKRRAVGATWLYVPEDGGVRTRPWGDVRIVEHKFWKGRLITEEY